MSGVYRGKRVTGQQKIKEEYTPFLSDEARISPELPDVLYFPETTEEVSQAVLECVHEEKACVVSGGRTGIGGGAVPSSRTSALISLERIQPPVALRWNDTFSVWSARVGAGLKLQEFLQVLKRKNYTCTEDAPDGLFFPVDPTETTATLGGMAATNASGARTLYYGAMRKWIIALTVVLADGSILRVQRGKFVCNNQRLSFNTGVRRYDIPVSPVTIPPTKHTAGYYLTESTDLVDLFIGSEGTLGIITELELRLTVPGPQNLYTILFLPKDEPAGLVEKLLTVPELPPVAMEYMDGRSLAFLRQFRDEQGEASGVPNIPGHVSAIIYLEYNCTGSESAVAAAKQLSDCLEETPCSSDETWTGFSTRTLDAMKKFRHALPERINSIIAERKQSIPELTKIGTDMAVPLDQLKPMLEEYRSVLTENDLEFCIFGHIGNGHVHVNIIPRNKKEMAEGWDLYTVFAQSVKKKGGSICAEHGIGRLKRKLLPIQFTKSEIEGMKRVKEVFDPDNRLNPDVLFPEPENKQ